MHFTRAVAVSRKDGSLHKVRSYSTTPQLAFGWRDPSTGVVVDDPIITISHAVVWIDLAVDGRGHRYAVVASHLTDQTTLVRYRGPDDWEEVVVSTQKNGAGWCAIRALDSGCEVYVQAPRGAGPDLTVADVYDDQGAPVRSVPVPYSATGIHQILDDGSVVMNDQGQLQAVINGVRFWNLYDCRGYRLGQIDQPADGVGLILSDGVTMRRVRTPTPEGWNGYTNQPSRMVVAADGTVWAAIPGHDTPEPDRIEWTELVAARVDPLPAIAVPPQRAIWRGVLGGLANWPGHLGGGLDTSGRPVVEGVGRFADGRPWLPPDREERLAAIFVSPHEPPDNQDWPATRERVLALARRTGACVIVYADRPAFDLWEVCDQFKADGIAAVVGLCGYPGGPEDSSDLIARRFHDEAQQARERGYKVALIRPLYTQSGNWPLPMLAQASLRLTQECAAEGMDHVVADIGFGWDRPPQEPWIQEYWTRLVAETPMPTGGLPKTPRQTPARPAPTPGTGTGVPGAGDEVIRVLAAAARLLAKRTEVSLEKAVRTLIDEFGAQVPRKADGSACTAKEVTAAARAMAAAPGSGAGGATGSGRGARRTRRGPS